MKKYMFTLMVLSFAIVLSCKKEDGIATNENNGKETFSAVIKDELVTKGTYEIDDKTNKATFSWDSGDTFIRIFREHNGTAYGKYDAHPYSYVSGTGNNATFS